jgi:predicted dehydrogenase
MFPPAGPVLRESDWQAAPSLHVRVNGESNGRLYVQNYTMGGSFLAGGKVAEQFAGMMKEMQTWLAAVRGEGELVVRPEQAYTVTCILEAIYQSAAAGNAVHLG